MMKKIPWQAQALGVSFLVIFFSVFLPENFRFISVFGMFGVFIFVIWWMADVGYKVQKTIQTIVDRKSFSKVDRFTFSTDRPSRLFKLGHSKHAYSVFAGESAGFPATFFRYRYATGTHKAQEIHSFMVYEFKVPDAQFPHIYLKPKNVFRKLERDMFGSDKDVQVPVSGDNTSYVLFCQKDYEIEALQIVTPDVLQLLESEHKELNKHVHIEFNKDTVTFFSDTYASKKYIEHLFEVGDNVMEKVGPLLRRMNDDFAAMHEVLSKK